jgi:hypothetical protein
MPQAPGEFGLAVSVTGTWVRTEHIAVDAVPETAPGPEYRHLQHLEIAEASAIVTRGLRRGLGVEAVLGLREVRTRIRFLDLDGRPFAPVYGALHHRNETLVGPTDPWLVLHAGRAGKVWSVGARVGLTLPLGRTEPDPFALGDAGLPHEHIQFGTGTFDPILGLGIARRIGATTLTASALWRLVVAENDKGYHAGNRTHASLVGSRKLRGAWSGNAGLDLSHETAERWHGRLHPEEGNLGRTDVLASLAVSRSMGRGAVSLNVRVPILVRATGSQLHYPVIATLGWAR